MTAPAPHWPGRMVSLAGGERVWVAATPGTLPADDRDRPGTSPAGRRDLAAPDFAAQPDTSAGGGRDLVLCVHGMSGSATNWTDLMAELVPDFDCAAVDLPGSGFSPPPAAGSGYSVGALAGTVIRLIEALGSDPNHRGPVHLVGNSMGGAVAVRVAARRPDLIKTLTLISPALPDLRPRRSVMHFPLIGLPFVGERLVRAYVARFPVENRVAGVFAMCFHDPSRLHPDRFALEAEALRRRDALGYDAVSLARAARTLVAETLRPAPFSLWRAAARITAPSLVLFGAGDRLVDPRLAARAARTFRDARVLVLPETGHLGQMECPAQVARLLREMVEEARAPGSVSAGGDPRASAGAPGQA
jgi:pimeloyl-ACP methyl ester carboxylesterase